MKIHLRFYGVFRAAVGSETTELELPTPTPTVRMALSQLFTQTAYRGMKGLVFDGESTDPRSTTLILVCGREIGALDGLDTELKDTDEVSLLPIAHGG